VNDEQRTLSRTTLIWLVGLGRQLDGRATMEASIELSMPHGGQRRETAGALARLSAALGVPDPWPLATLESEIKAQVLPSGAVLFREGDLSDAMYLVLRGELQATVPARSTGR
jgi:hypothetical protein